jgi:hypothetical protein
MHVDFFCVMIAPFWQVSWTGRHLKDERRAPSNDQEQQHPLRGKSGSGSDSKGTCVTDPADSVTAMFPAALLMAAFAESFGI